MPPMSEAEWRAFLTEGTRTGKLATVRTDGRPHVAPVWFVLDDDGTVVFTTWHASVKGRTLLRDPRVAMSVDDQAPPYSYVIIEGTATISRDLDDLGAWATRIARRYMGDDLAESYGARNAVPGELLVRIHPTHVIGQSAISG
ncbi:MAG TPA: PPOX class F420-dependent oxidoreductase [Actinomycetota bacterium]|nr:PPOX class F420-dependent oxidoreductase [Actinomycetota bacterium]